MHLILSWIGKNTSFINFEKYQPNAPCEGHWANPRRLKGSGKVILIKNGRIDPPGILFINKIHSDIFFYFE